MSESAKGQDRLNRIAKSKSYRDSYLSAHVRAGVAYQIQALREHLSLSQEAFAKRIGKPQSVVSRLENPDYGRVTIQTLIEVAQSLDVALTVRFCNYYDFLKSIEDVSINGLSVESLDDTIAKCYEINKPLKVLQLMPSSSPEPRGWHEQQAQLPATSRAPWMGDPLFAVA